MTGPLLCFYCLCESVCFNETKRPLVSAHSVWRSNKTSFKGAGAYKGFFCCFFLTPVWWKRNCIVTLTGCHSHITTGLLTFCRHITVLSSVWVSPFVLLLSWLSPVLLCAGGRSHSGWTGVRVRHCEARPGRVRRPTQTSASDSTGHLWRATNPPAVQYTGGTVCVCVFESLWLWHLIPLTYLKFSFFVIQHSLDVTGLLHQKIL